MKLYRARRVDTNKEVKGWYVEVGRPYILPLGKSLNTDFVEVIPSTVSQSTGRKDKHGVEIYGGMKIKSLHSDRILQVAWSEPRLAWVAREGKNENLLAGWCLDTFEIIPEGE